MKTGTLRKAALGSGLGVRSLKVWGSGFEGLPFPQHQLACFFKGICKAIILRSPEKVGFVGLWGWGFRRTIWYSSLTSRCVVHALARVCARCYGAVRVSD